MTPKSDLLSLSVIEYILNATTPPDPVLADLAAETAALGGVSRMQIAPDQGVLLGLLSRLVRPSFAVEVGTFTGYSAICLARELAPGGRLLCCDTSAEWTAIAARYFARAGVDSRIELRLAPAIETLTALPERPQIDLAFIDADKGGYLAYWEQILARLRPGGVVLADNTLWRGAVADPAVVDADTVALREFSALVAADDRVDQVLLPVADGLSFAVRR